jgi:hypothetical protein
LESDHNRIDIHAENEDAFRWACKNGHLDVVKFLLSLESERRRIDIHCWNDYAFRNSNFHTRHLLIQYDPCYNWQNVKEYRKELEQIIECLATLHQNLIQFDTDILELNVVGIVKEFLLG